MASFLGLLMVAYLLFSSFAFQTYLTGRITSWVNEKFHTRISVGELSYDGWSYFSLRQVMFGDQKQDTLFYAGRLQFNLAGIAIDSTTFRLNHVVLDEGLCKILTYKDSTFSIDAMFAFTEGDTTPSVPGPPFRLELKNLEVMDTRFVMIDSTETFEPEGFDAFNMHVSDVNFRSRFFQIIDDSLHFDMHQFSCREKSGFQIKRMEAVSTISSSTIRLDKMEMVTAYSVFRDYFSLDYKSWDDYMDFENKVKFNIRMKRSDVDFRDIVYFAPFLNEFNYKATVSGKAKGPLASLTIRDVMASHGKDTYFEGDVRLNGLPDIDHTFMDIEARYASSNADEVQTISGLEMPDFLRQFGKVEYEGRYTGFYTDFVSFGKIQTMYGNIQTDLNMKLDTIPEKSAYSGSLAMTEFDAGKVFQGSGLGRVSLQMNVNGKGFDLKQIQTRLTASLDKLEWNGYPFSGIDLDADLSRGNLGLNLNIDDSSLVMDASGNMNLLQNFKHLRMNSHIEDADLNAIKLLKDIRHLGMDIESDFYFKDLDENYGSIQLSNVQFEKNAYSTRINSLRLDAKNGDEKLIALKGDYLDAFIKGQYDFDNLLPQLNNLLADAFPNLLKPKSIPGNPKQDFTWELKLFSSSYLSPLFFPEYQASRVDLKGFFKSEQGSALIQGGVGSLNLDGLIFNQNTLKLSMGKEKMFSLLYGLKSVGKKDTLYLGDIGIKLDGTNNYCESKLFIRDTSGWVNGELEYAIQFKPQQELALQVSYGELGKGSNMWQLAPGELLGLSSGKLYFHELELRQNAQQFKLDGFYDLNGPSKNLSLNIANLQLATLLEFAPNLGFYPSGLADGFLIYRHVGKHDVVLGDVQLEGLSLDGDTLGDFDLRTGYQEADNKVLLSVNSPKGKIKHLKGEGYYDIDKEYINLDIGFKESEIASFQAFVKDYVKLMEGTAALNGHLSGPISMPQFEGSLLLLQAKVRIEYLKTVYKFNRANVNFDRQNMDIIPFMVEDVNGKTGRVSGNINHNGFNQFKYNLHIDGLKGFQVLNTTSTDNNLFYGQAYGTGAASISGNTNQVRMHVTAKSEKGTQITINPFGGEAESGDGLINYVDYDTTGFSGNRAKAIPFGFGIVLDLEATPDAEMQMLFSATSDDRIRAKGTGKVKLELTPEGNFLMNGKVNLLDGEYRFSAMNLVAKKFVLKPGGSVEWNGDPFTGKIDIDGIYKLRTTISEIVNTSSNADPNIRIPVECIINIKGTVERPLISFDMNFPDLQNNLNGSAASELNAVLSNFRREPDLMNQQIVFLLISGKFIPLNNTSNNVAGSLGTQTVSDLLSKQAAGLLTRLDPNLDLTVDMLNATDPTKSRAALISASRRVLDNRLELQGSFATDNSQNNFQAVYTFRKNGSLKAKAFNRMGFDPIYSRNITTSGLGLYYRREFDHIYELFGKKEKEITPENP